MTPSSGTPSRSTASADDREGRDAERRRRGRGRDPVAERPRGPAGADHPEQRQDRHGRAPRSATAPRRGVRPGASGNGRWCRRRRVHTPSVQAYKVGGRRTAAGSRSNSCTTKSGARAWGQVGQRDRDSASYSSAPFTVGPPGEVVGHRAHEHVHVVGAVGRARWPGRCSRRGSRGTSPTASRSSTTNTSGVPGGRVAAIRPASVAPDQVLGGHEGLSDRAGHRPSGTANSATRIAVRHDGEPAARFGALPEPGDAPSAARIGSAKPNVMIRSGGNHPVAKPDGTPIDREGGPRHQEPAGEPVHLQRADRGERQA